MSQITKCVSAGLLVSFLNMAAPSIAGGQSYSLQLEPLHRFLSSDVDFDVHRASHVFKRCAALMYSLYQFSSNQSAEFRSILLDNYSFFVLLIRNAENQIVNLSDTEMGPYIERNIAPYVENYTHLMNKSYLERGNYTSDELIDADTGFCGNLKSQMRR